MSYLSRISFSQTYSARVNVSTKSTGAALKNELDAMLAETETVPQSSGDLYQEQQTASGVKTYSPDTVMMNYLKSVTENNAKMLRDMLDKIMSSQGYMAKGEWRLSVNAWGSMEQDAEKWQSFGFSMDFSFNFDFTFAPDDEVRAQAEAMLGEDGPLGVKQVTDNILKFAKAISGGDPAKIDMLRDAVLQGFDQAAALFGGSIDKLPEISQQTYEAVMKGFDAWKEESLQAEAELPPPAENVPATEQA